MPFDYIAKGYRKKAKPKVRFKALLMAQPDCYNAVCMFCSVGAAKELFVEDAALNIWQWITETANAYPELAYLIILVGTFLEGETIVILIASMAADGRPNLALIILSAFAGSLAGDQTWFYVGRFKGKRLLAKRPLWQQKAQKVYRLLERHSTWLLLGFRFLYGLRNVTPFALGMSELSGKRFLILNAIGAAIWAFAFGYGGYKIGEALETNLKHYRFHVLAALCLIVAAIWLAKVIRNHRRSKKALAQQKAAQQPE